MTTQRSVAHVRDILLQEKVVDTAQMRAALGHMAKWGGRLPRIVVDLGLAEDTAVVNALARGFRLPTIRLVGVQADPAAMQIIGEAFCEAHAVIPVSIADGVLTLAIADPTDVGATAQVAALTQTSVKPVLASELEIAASLESHAQLTGSVSNADKLKSVPEAAIVARRTSEGVPVETSGTSTDSMAEKEQRAKLNHALPRSPDDMSRLPLVSDLSAPTFDLDSVMPQVPTRMSPTHSLLDELFERTSAGAQPTTLQLQRLETARITQHKTKILLDTVRALLSKNGLKFR
jgi:Type II secretion system (T2SS), protein E, N-terminal domain